MVVSSGYVPPYATATTTATATSSSGIVFTSVAKSAGTATATSGTATASATAVIVDANGGVDSSSLLEYFTRPYLDAHTLSVPTWRYAYILWFIIIGTLLLWSALYHLNRTGTGGTALGARFRKWSIRRVTWTKGVGGGSKGGVGLDQTGVEAGNGAARTRKKVVWASPTLAQTITVLVLVAAALCVSLIGDDYIAPTTCVFGGECPYQAYGATGPPKSTYRAKRALPDVRSPSFASDVVPPPSPAGSVSSPVNIVKRGVNNPNGWAPFNDPLLASSNKNIAANAWSAAARLGLISYAMLPLAVTLALKQWPFNIWATPFLTNYHFDKTAILHRWSGRVIWAFSTAHAIGWFYQLSQDRDPFGRMVLVPIWAWYKFCAGAVAWGLLTVLTAFSFKPIRTRFYELFYWSHVVLVVLFLVACIFHHTPLLWWPAIALIWWTAERVVRFASFLYINGLLEGIWLREPSASSRRSRQNVGVLDGEKSDGYNPEHRGQAGSYPPASFDESSEPLRMSRQGSFNGQQYPPPSPSLPLSSSLAPSYHLYPSASSARLLPPPGFASAQLLPGRTIRLTIHVPHSIRWAPGQHLLLYMPQVRSLDTHPYTVASVDERAKGLGGVVESKKGSEVVLLVRAQQGFSKALWDHVVKKRRAGADGSAGVNLRAMVSMPMGSAARVSWGAYETLTIICGGTGISFVSVLEYACRRMARREEDAKWKTTRVRFVWILREFAHLSWAASTIRRCIELCGSDQLQVDLFVTHSAPKLSSRRQQPQASYDPYSAGDDLAPPTAPFARGARPGNPPSRDSMQSELSDFSDNDGESPPTTPRLAQQQGEEVDSVTDLVLFEGEDDYRTPGEAEVSAKLKKQGKLRRALSRRGQGGSLRRPGAAPVTHSPPSPPRHRQQNPYADSTGSFEALPLDHHDETAPSYSHSRSGSDDIGARHAHSNSYDKSSSYPYDDGRSEVGTLVDPSGTSTRHLFSKGGDYSSTHHGSHADLVSLANYQAPSTAARAAAQDPDDSFFLDITPQEQDDLDAVAELAKNGYPRLKEIIDDEVERSAGKTLVAVCGPSGLNHIVRNLVSRKIDLKRVRKGDPRGQTALFAEDFTN